MLGLVDASRPAGVVPDEVTEGRGNPPLDRHGHGARDELELVPRLPWDAFTRVPLDQGHQASFQLVEQPAHDRAGHPGFVQVEQRVVEVPVRR